MFRCLCNAVHLSEILNDRNWELLAAWQGTKVKVPTKFIAGDKDIGFESTREYVTGDIFKQLVPNLEVVILDGHHFIQQERAQEVSEEILCFLRKVSLDSVSSQV